MRIDIEEIDFAEIQWDYEDELSENVGKREYDMMFQNSKIIDGVRMFPYMEIRDRSSSRVQKYYLI